MKHSRGTGTVQKETNQESEYCRNDVMLELKNKLDDAYILEFKVKSQSVFKVRIKAG